MSSTPETAKPVPTPVPETPKPKESLLASLVKPFVVGSISGVIATSVIQPVDTVKVLIQSRKEAAGKTQVNLSPFFIAKEVIQNNGVKGTSLNIKVFTKDLTQPSSDRLFTAVCVWVSSELLRSTLKTRKTEQ